MSTDNRSVPHPPHPVNSLRTVLLRTEQEAQLAGSPHSAIELALDALRRGEIHAQALCAGQSATRRIEPVEWNDLTIEIAPQQMFEVNGPPSLVVRSSDPPHGPGHPPAMTQVHFDAEDKQAATAPSVGGITGRPSVQPLL
jgi:hypothetical protein